MSHPPGLRGPAPPPFVVILGAAKNLNHPNVSRRKNQRTAKSAAPPVAAGFSRAAPQLLRITRAPSPPPNARVHTAYVSLSLQLSVSVLLRISNKFQLC